MDLTDPMVWMPWTIAGILFVASVANAVHALKQLAVARRLPTSHVRDIQKPGVYEVMGRAITPDPVAYSGHKCVWYRYVRYRTYDPHGVGRRSRTVRECKEIESVPFMVQDATGVIGVDLDNAQVDARELINRKESYYGWASFLFSSDGAMHEVLTGVEVDKPVYVAGMVVREGGVLSFRDFGKTPLLISFRSESAYRRSRAVSALRWSLLALACPLAAWLLAGYVVPWLAK